MAGYSVLLTLKIIPERLDEFVSMLEAEAPLTRAFPGCVRFDVYILDAAEGDVLFLEDWRSQEDQVAYGDWRAERGDMDRLAAFFYAPPARAVLQKVAAAD